MKRSESRILTTHAGSLPRPKPLVDLQLRMSRGEAVESAALAGAVEQAMRRAVERQLECGIDVGNDGEQPRESFFTYVRYRMSGFGGREAAPARAGRGEPIRSFRELFQTHARKSLHTAPPRAIGEVRYVNRASARQRAGRVPEDPGAATRWVRRIVLDCSLAGYRRVRNAERLLRLAWRSM